MSNETIRLCLKSLNILANAALFLLAVTGVSLLINMISAAGLLMPIMFASLCLSVVTIPGNKASTTMLTAFLPFSLYLIATGAVVELYKWIDNKINSRFPEEVHFSQRHHQHTAFKFVSPQPPQAHGFSAVPPQQQPQYTLYEPSAPPSAPGVQYPNLGQQQSDSSYQPSIGQPYIPPQGYQPPTKYQ